jgi:PIN domain nuclease of toxin-antitoxin system
VGRATLRRLLLDTNALVWLAADSDRLGGEARAAIAAAIEESSLLVSAISFWEVALLTRRGRLAGPADADVWRDEALASGIEELPVTGTIGIAAVALDGLHGDPADRLIVATAIAFDATLVTADKALLHWEGQLSRLDAAV